MGFWEIFSLGILCGTILSFFALLLGILIGSILNYFHSLRLDITELKEKSR